MEEKNIENENLNQEFQDEYQEYDSVNTQSPRKRKRGFTLIELLAVVIILGVLMIVAIPAVTSYISGSRKSAYVDTAKEIANATKHVVNDGKQEMYDTDTTYYVESGYIKTENANKSPYGEFVNAYSSSYEAERAINGKLKYFQQPIARTCNGEKPNAYGFIVFVYLLTP